MPGVVSKISRQIYNVKLELRTRMTRSLNPHLLTDKEMEDRRNALVMMENQQEHATEIRSVKVSMETNKVDTLQAVAKSSLDMTTRINNVEASHRW